MIKKNCIGIKCLEVRDRSRKPYRGAYYSTSPKLVPEGVNTCPDCGEALVKPRMEKIKKSERAENHGYF